MTPLQLVQKGYEYFGKEDVAGIVSMSEVEKSGASRSNTIMSP